MPQTVLVVDDSAFARRVLRDVLDRAGFHVVEAVSGSDAVELFASLRPEAVTMDLAMPGMSGIECIRELRAIDAGARIVVVSALDPDGARELSLETGACAYVRKPFQPAALLDIVRKCVLRPPGALVD